MDVELVEIFGSVLGDFVLRFFCGGDDAGVAAEGTLPPTRNCHPGERGGFVLQESGMSPISSRKSAAVACSAPDALAGRSVSALFMAE